jgi:aspartate/methionine/tyrosine aminotransferase
MPVEIEPFRAIAISRLAHELRDQGRDIVHMAFGQPSTGAPPRAIARAHEVLDADVMGYWESPALRARLARHYRETYGVEIEPERFVLTCGGSPALVVGLLSAFPRGGTIAIARPGYVSYRNTAKALGMVPLEIACGPDTHFQLTADHLARLDPAPAGVILSSPANPTGSIIPEAEMAAIAEVCRARGIGILSDEIYHGLSYVGRCHSILEFEPNAQVVHSFSKYFSMVGLAPRVAGGDPRAADGGALAGQQPVPHRALAQPACRPCRHGRDRGAGRAGADLCDQP